MTTVRMHTARRWLPIVRGLVAMTVAGCGDNRLPDDLSIAPEAITVAVGADATLTASLGESVPIDVVWTSSAGTIARVTPGANGIATVRGIAPGSVTISATLNHLSAFATVTVAPSIDLTARQR
jgi:uncharacterized protein YjdB